ncbi:GntR family transcriptional regulator [Sulfitobacter sp. JB4-11]|uniref:GntR family transcriptional regulator n=1 Tax=Sulfitobacter rhodophyticola TaxID=3238304 RepID=UPI0035124F07
MSDASGSERLVAQNLSGLALQRLEKAIMEGELGPGERLSESGLARRFGISRGPLREAIGQLEGRKLVTRVSNQGARVVSLSKDDLLDLLQVRESLEGMACRLASERMSEADLAQLENMLAAHEKTDAMQSGRGYFQAPGDGDFHQVILAACGNARLSGMLGNELYSLLRLYRHRLSMRPGRPAEALEEHKRILAALKARDPDAAEAAMRAHLRSSLSAVEDWLTDEDLGK